MTPSAFEADKPRIAIVGAGPTAIYSLQALVNSASAIARCAVTLFE